MPLLMKYSSRTSHTLISLANGTSRTLINLPLMNGLYWRMGGTRAKRPFLPSCVFCESGESYEYKPRGYIPINIMC